MVHIINGSVLDSCTDYIAHQTNCLGIAGAGVALAIRKQFPNWFSVYKEYCTKNQHNALGTVQVIGKIINIFGQYGIGRSQQQTDYSALQSAFLEIVNKLPHHSSIAFPFGFGCGLAGGNWNIVYHLIDSILSPHFDIYIYKI